MSLEEKRALQIGWDDVCEIATEQIEKILGQPIKCKVNLVESEYWDLRFEDIRLPVVKLCQLMQSTEASMEAWEEALPDEGMVDVGNTGMELAELLLGQYLQIIWEERLITEDSLWLVGVTKAGRTSLEKLADEWLEITTELLQSMTEMCSAR